MASKDVEKRPPVAFSFDASSISLGNSTPLSVDANLEEASRAAEEVQKKVERSKFMMSGRLLSSKRLSLVQSLGRAAAAASRGSFATNPEIGVVRAETGGGVEPVSSGTRGEEPTSDVRTEGSATGRNVSRTQVAYKSSVMDSHVSGNDIATVPIASTTLRKCFDGRKRRRKEPSFLNCPLNFIKPESRQPESPWVPVSKTVIWPRCLQ